MWVVHGASLIRTTLWDSLGALHHQCPAGLLVFIFSCVRADVTSWFGFDGVLAVRVVGAAIEDAETSTTL